MGGLLNLATLVVIFTALALMIKNASGTTAFFNGLGNLWGKSINGILGKTS